MDKMLINATHPEEIRVALISGNHLYDLDIDCPSEVKKKGNIYKAVVTRVEPSLDAVFVEYGAKRQGFLPVKEIAPEYFSKKYDNNPDAKPTLTDLIKEGQDLLIQVDKEERGNKGAALTTFITLAGCYLVLMPNNPQSGGISRRIDGDERDELKETLNALNLEDDMGIIIRTAGVGKNVEELQADLNMLTNQWHAIKKAYTTHLAPCLIHQEGDVIIRSIRDNLRKSIEEIVIDDHVSYVKAKHYIEQIKPSFVSNIKLYNNSVPLFIHYGIEKQIESAYKREVGLPSGGALVIDRTEALVSIDINSAKATSGTDIETTAFNTNLEAANEIARQLRLRDLGGLVVIDFIDMNSAKNQREVENRLKDALSADRARIQVGRISRFGLLEMSRQRLRPSLGESSQEVCPRCEGRGTVRNIPSHALSLVRLIEEEALKEKTAEIHVQLPVEMATFIINEKREFIQEIEKRHKIHILIIANPYLHMPQYNITRVKEDNVGKTKRQSHTLIQNPELEMIRLADENKHPDEPVVQSIASSHPIAKPQQASLIKRLWSSLFGASSTTGDSTSKKGGSRPNQNRPHRNNNDRRNNNNMRRRRGGGNNPNQQNRQQNRNPNQQQAQGQATGQVQGQNQQRRNKPNHPRQDGGNKVVKESAPSAEE